MHLCHYGLYVLRDKLGNRIIQSTIMTVTYILLLVSVYSIGLKGLRELLQNGFNTVLNGTYTHAVMTDSNGLRLTSVFQYANTYAF